MMEFMTSRVMKFREALAQKELEAALVTKRENIRYISGFTGTSACLVICENRLVLITDSRYTEQAGRQAPGWEIIETKADTDESIKEVISGISVEYLGFEELCMSHGRYEKLKKKIDCKMKPIGTIIENLRMIKDRDEIEAMKKAVEIGDKAFEYVLGILRPGIVERDVAAEIEFYLKKNGAEDKAFDTIVASGYRSSMPHGVASEKVIEKGEAVTMDFGAVYGGYCSDMTRTVFIGEPDAEMKKVYDIVLKAQLKAMEGAFEGLLGREIDKIARDSITGAGYGDFFGHGLGHGVGLEVHEAPRLSPRGDVTVKNGMTVTVEPGVYLPGKGGVRIEDLIVINGNKPEILTGSDKAMIIL